MDNEAKQILNKRFAELPSEVQQALRSPKFHEHVEAVGKKHSLHIDQLGALEDETVFVMMGMSDPADFPKEIVAAARLSPAVAEEVAMDIAEVIFIPIREAMKAFSEKEASNDAASAAAPVVSSPPPAGVSKPVPTKLVPAAVSAPAPAKPPATLLELHPADISLSQSTTSTPKKVESGVLPTVVETKSAQMPQKNKYGTDPYREPIE